MSRVVPPEEYYTKSDSTKEILIYPTGIRKLFFRCNWNASALLGSSSVLDRSLASPSLIAYARLLGI